MNNSGTEKAGRIGIYGTFVLTVVTALLAAGCVGPLRVDSLWQNGNVVVNGKSDDWRGALYYFEDSDFSLGLRNDEDHLYLCLTAESPMMRMQIMAQGLTIWFDPAAGKEKVFGIRFPMGRTENPGERPPREGGQRPQETPQRRQMDPEAQERMLQNLIRDAVLIGPEKDALNQVPIEDLRDIQLDIDLRGGLLTYEMKIPLEPREDRPYAVGAGPGMALGVGLEIPKMDRSEMRRMMPSVMGGRGGMGGMGGGMGAPRRMPGTRPGITNGLKFWMKVTLAKPSQPAG
jgi:hypothetical protein